MSTFKKIAMRAAASAVTAAAAYGAKKLITRLLSSDQGKAAVVPSAEEIAERARMGRMSRKARKAYRAGQRAHAEA
jgi:hypothetical protein